MILSPIQRFSISTSLESNTPPPPVIRHWCAVHLDRHIHLFEEPSGVVAVTLSSVGTSASECPHSFMLQNGDLFWPLRKLQSQELQRITTEIRNKAAQQMSVDPDKSINLEGGTYNHISSVFAPFEHTYQCVNVR